MLVHKTEFSLITSLIDNNIKFDASEMLGIGDVVISERTVLERKGGGYDEYGNYSHDFVASIKDGRIWKQCQNMMKNWERRVLLLEDYDHLFDDTSINKKSILGTMASISVKYGTSIIPSNSTDDSIYILLKLIEDDKKDGYYTPVNIHPKSKTVYEDQIYLVSGLLLVGLKKAKELLNMFGSPYEIFKAISSSKYIVPDRGSRKKLVGVFSKMKGYGNVFVDKNKKLLTQVVELSKSNVNK